MVTSLPAGAEVWLDGVVVGTTPLAMTLSAGSASKHLLEIQTPGYGIRQIPIAVAPHLAGKALVFNETLVKEQSKRRSAKPKRKPRASSERTKTTRPLKGLKKHLKTRKYDPLDGI